MSTFGIPFEDRVELAPAIGGWGELALGRELRAAFPGADIAMATDAKAAALAEARWGALAGCDPGPLPEPRHRAVRRDRHRRPGGRAARNGAAGEIGYNLRAVSDVGWPWPDRVPLEGMVSARALGQRAASAPADGTVAAEVVRGQRRRPGAGRLVSEFVAELAFHLVNLAICIDPVRIAVGGGMAGSWDRLRARPGAGAAGAAPRSRPSWCSPDSRSTPR